MLIVHQIVQHWDIWNLMGINLSYWIKKTRHILIWLLRYVKVNPISRWLSKQQDYIQISPLHKNPIIFCFIKYLYLGLKDWDWKAFDHFFLPSLRFKSLSRKNLYFAKKEISKYFFYIGRYNFVIPNIFSFDLFKGSS